MNELCMLRAILVNTHKPCICAKGTENQKYAAAWMF